MRGDGEVQAMDGKYRRGCMGDAYGRELSAEKNKRRVGTGIFGGEVWAARTGESIDGEK